MALTAFDAKALLLAGMIAFTVVISGCAGVAPVPGGTDTTNVTFYTTEDDFLSRISRITPGMPEDAVFKQLGREKHDMVTLRRDEVMTALLGTNNVALGNNRDRDDAYFESLYGYRLTYKIIKRKHGFSSPIRVRTDESGFDYTVTLVFKNSKLAEKPILTGGVVNNSSSRTFFDFLSPGTAIERMK